MNKEKIIQALSELYFKNGTRLVDKMSALVIRDDRVGFSIEVLENEINEANTIKDKATKILQELSNYKVTIVLTSATIKENTDNKYTTSKYKLPNIKNIICISSGKGGVGKSTISALFAQHLALTGCKVGLVDADIYGPSIPKIFGIENSKPEIDNGKFIPITVKGLKLMSIGLIVPQESSIIWRGPMTSKAIHQLLIATNWGELDYLVIDMPPGTGDIHLSLLEKFVIDGVILVTTPQKLAFQDAARAADMYQKFNVPMIGVIENMSYLLLEDGAKLNIFGEGAGKALAKKYSTKLLCKIPIDSNIAKSCDNGEWLADRVDICDIISNLERIG